MLSSYYAVFVGFTVYLLYCLMCILSHIDMLTIRHPIFLPSKKKVWELKLDYLLFRSSSLVMILRTRRRK